MMLGDTLNFLLVLEESGAGSRDSKGRRSFSFLIYAKQQYVKY